MRYVVGLLLCLAIVGRTVCAQGAGTGPAARYLGLRYPPLPAELHSLLSSAVSHDDSVRYIIEYLQDRTKHFLWLARDTLTVANGRSASFEVRTVLTLPRLRSKETLVQNCRAGSRDSPGELDLVGIITLGPHEVQRPRRAWHIDWQHERIVEVPTRDITCIDEGYYERRGR